VASQFACALFDILGEREHLSRAWRIYTDGGSRKADEIRARLDELGGPLAE
jgi:hypothetical protein